MKKLTVGKCVKIWLISGLCEECVVHQNHLKFPAIPGILSPFDLKGRTMQAANDRALEWLKLGDIRPTKQRVTLAEYLVGDGQDRHVSAEYLHRCVSENDAAVSLATVYNTLKLFSEAGLIQEIIVDGSKSYFDTRLDDHQHFFCDDTGELSDTPADSVKFERIPEAPEGYEISKVDAIVRLRKKSH